MAVYVSLSLLAVLIAIPPGAGGSSALTVFLTAIALMLAHQVAFRVSSRLVNRGVLDAESLRLLGAQTVGGLAAAVVAAVPVALFGASGGDVAEFVLLAFIAATGYRAARSVPASRPRSLGYVAILVVVVVAVLMVKSLVGH